MRSLFAALSVVVLCACTEQSPPQTGAGVPTLTRPTELRDFGMAPTADLRTGNYHANTPRIVPGARTITTAELVELMRQPRPPLLIDTLGGSGHATVPGASWMPGAGRAGSYGDDVQRRLISSVDRLTGGDRNRTVVTLCLSELCWLSYNAALRLVRAGFTDVRWYRGGTEAWAAAGQPTASAVAATW
jgi:rhodanese-related sulfurtransferase